MSVDAEALYARTAKPGVEFEAKYFIRFRYNSRMQAGLLLGFLGQFENIIKHLKQDLGKDYKVVLTGGLSKFIAKHSNVVDIVDEVCSEGIELYKMHKTIILFVKIRRVKILPLEEENRLFVPNVVSKIFSIFKEEVS